MSIQKPLLGALIATYLISILGITSTAQAAAYRPEQSLLGIKIFDRANVVLKKFGNPSRIITGSSSSQSGAPQPQGPQQGPMTNGALPALPMPGAPGAPAPELNGGQPANGQTPGASTPQPSQVVWEFDLRNSIIVNVTLSNDGRVVQISVSGMRDPTALTSRGVTLGSPYITVLGKYGYPESQDTAGSILTALYSEKAHCAFQFMNNKVVSITVAAVE